MWKCLGSRFLILAAMIALCFPAAAAGTFTVTNVNDSGPGSLRAAIIAANGAGGGTIVFAIGSGVQTIRPESAFPAVQSATIDGRTQPGYSGKPLIEIDGSNTLSGSVFILRDSAAHGLVVNRAPNLAFFIENSRVDGCYVGVDPTGMVARPNERGVMGRGVVTNSVISANSSSNVFIDAGSQVTNNIVGLTANGATAFATYINIAVGNADQYDDSTSPVEIRNNVVGGGAYGIDVRNDGTVIEENVIGVNRSGKPVPSGTGIFVYDAVDTRISENTIAFHKDSGVTVGGAAKRTRILNNSIHSNAFIGIDLSTFDSRVTPNDAGDGDSGPNNLINFPVLTHAGATTTNTTIAGTIDSRPNATFTVELFVSPACSPVGHGEGKERLVRFTVTTDSSGNASFEQTLAKVLPNGHFVTALATSDEDGTSEFSKCVEVEGAGVFSFSPSQVTAYESGSKATITVVRKFGSFGTATVNYATANGTATAGVDFAATSGTLNFAHGELSKTIEVTILNDAIYETTKMFEIALSDPTAGTLGAERKASVTLHDDEPVPVLTVAEVRGPEGDSGTKPFVFTARLSGPAAAPLSVAYTTVDVLEPAAGVDYVSTSGTFVFAPGVTTQTFEVQVIGDQLFEGEEAFTVKLTTDSKIVTQFGIIENDDPEPTMSADVTSVRETDGREVVTITLTMSQPVLETFGWETSSGTAMAGEDFVQSAGNLRYVNQSVRTIEIPIAGDTTVEDREQFFITIYSWGDMPAIEERFKFTITIEDDDVGVGPSRLMVPNGETRDGVIQIGAPAATDLVFALTSSAPQRVSVPTSVTIPAGQKRARFAVRAHSADAREQITVTHPNSSGTSVVNVVTYTPAQLTLSPSEVTLVRGEVATVHAMLAPAGDAEIVLSADGSVEVPTRLTIGADGRGSFTIKGVTEGTFIVTATLPLSRGGEASRLFGAVVAAPPVPALHSIVPNNGATSGGTAVAVRGVLFRADCTLTFAGVPATTQFVDATTLNAIAPPHAAGTVDVVLTCGSDVASLDDAFTYRAATPQLSSVAPASGSTEGGTYVRISGSDIAPSCWPLFDGVPARDALVRDASTITAIAPPHASGKARVGLVCTGTSTLLENAFTYSTAADAAAQITRIAPAAAAAGEVVLIEGSGFRPSDEVRFGELAARVLDSTPTSHTVIVPALSAGPTNVTIRAGENLTTTGPVFTVSEPKAPRITRVSLIAAAGAEIVIEGTSLRAPYTFAMNGVPLPIVSLLPNRAVVRLPNGITAGSHPIAIVDPNNQIATLGPAVNVRTEGVVVTSVVAACAQTDGGIDVTITGSGFASGASVTFDEIPATNVVVVNATTITARVPANYAGSATIAVKNSDGSTSTLTDAFRYASPFDPSGCTGRRLRAVRH